MENGRIKHVVIVGGGTSGWLAAGFLSRLYGPNTLDQLKVTLVESQDIGQTRGLGDPLGAFHLGLYTPFPG